MIKAVDFDREFDPWNEKQKKTQHQTPTMISPKP